MKKREIIPRFILLFLIIAFGYANSWTDSFVIETNSETIIIELNEISSIRFEGDVSSEDFSLLVPILNAKLYQNYPNPFNPSGAGRSPTTTISFELIEDTTSEITINIFNIKGQKVKQLLPTLCHPEFIEGRGVNIHSVVWNGRDNNNLQVASGIYFYQLQVDNEIKTKKMILLK